MGPRQVVEALKRSAFLADVGERDRDLVHLAILMLGGAGIFVATLLFGMGLLIAQWWAVGAPGGVAGFGEFTRALTENPAHDIWTAFRMLVFAAIMNSLIAVTFTLLAARLYGRRLRDYLTAAPRIRWRLLAMGLVLTGIAMAPVMAWDVLRSDEPPALPLLHVSTDLIGRAGYGLAVLVLLIPAAAAEEAVFRGWLLKQTAAFTHDLTPLLVINGLAFSAIHGDFTPDAFLTRAVMGAGFAYMTLRLGGIEFSIGAHAANNILILLFVQPLTLQTSVTPTMSADSTIADLVIAVIYVGMTEAVIRWPPLRRLARLEAPAPAAAVTAAAP